MAQCLMGEDIKERTADDQILFDLGITDQSEPLPGGDSTHFTESGTLANPAKRTSRIGTTCPVGAPSKFGSVEKLY